MSTITIIQDASGPKGPRAVDVTVTPNTVLGFGPQGDPVAVEVTPAGVGAEPAGAAAAAVAGLVSDAAFGPTEVGTKVAQNARGLLGMDSAGRLLANAGVKLQSSADNGATWADIHTFDSVISGVRQLDNGELLVGVGENPGTHNATLWRSTGYTGGSPTWALVLTSSGATQSLDMGWNFGTSGAIVVVNEYGTDARYVYLSQDYGATWATIYDNGISGVAQRHLHGCTYDKYRGAIWISAGDFNGVEDNDHISVSWNLGVSWTKVTNLQQPTVIVAFPNCVCFGTDNTPNGVLRIVDPSPTSLDIEVAYAIDNSKYTGNVALFSFTSPSPGSPTLISYAGGVGTVGLVLASYDGFSWFKLWTDTVDASQVTKAVGPTAEGRVLIRTSAGGTYGSLVSVAAPTKGMIATLERAGRGSRDFNTTARKPFVTCGNKSTPFQDVGAYAYVTVLTSPIYGKDTTPYGLWRDDPAGVFTIATDGITINKAGLYSIIADCCLNLAAGITGYCVIQFDGVTKVVDKTARIAWKGYISSGVKVSVQAFCTSATTLVGSDVLTITAEFID